LRILSNERFTSKFIGKDIRRDVVVVDSSEIESGLITVKTRTWNVLYASKGIKRKPFYGKIRKIEIEKLWVWNGTPWGGPVSEEIDQ
jgi:hypothetical protein